MKKSGNSILSVQTRYDLLWFGIFAILLANAPLFTTANKVNWDAFAEMWEYYRWIGSSLREGYYPDFFPNILSGYPIGANIQAGVYNIFYLAAAYTFPDSVLSINFVYIMTQIAIFCLAYGVGRTYSLDSVCTFYLGLALVGCGFVIGHAEHFSYLATATGLLACFFAIRLALAYQGLSAFILAFVGVYHILSAGYPSNIIFGAQCLIIYWVYVFFTMQNARWYLLLIPYASILGALLSLPALWHFLHQVQQSTRGEGLDIETALSGSLPRYALLNFVFPLWRMWFSEPSMERFHLTFIGSPLAAIAIWKAVISNKHRKQILTWLALVFVFTALALGKNSPLQLRTWLAEHFFIYRIGRFPSGEHSGIALFLLALISAFGMQHIREWFRGYDRVYTVIIVLDFLLVMCGLHYMRYSDTPPAYQGTVPQFKISYNSHEQALIDAPRICVPVGQKWTVTALRQQRDLAPSKFYWDGYANLRDKAYEQDKNQVSNMVCGPSRLWLAEDQSPCKYELIAYTPGYIAFTVRGGYAGIKSKLIWADYDDGFWKLKINSVVGAFDTTPAKLRGFYAMQGDKVEMIYAGPLTRLWRK